MKLPLPQSGDRVKIIRPMPYDTQNVGIGHLAYIPVGCEGVVSRVDQFDSGDLNGEIAIYIKFDEAIKDLEYAENTGCFFPCDNDVRQASYCDEPGTYHHNGFEMSPLFAFHYHVEFLSQRERPLVTI